MAGLPIESGLVEEPEGSLPLSTGRAPQSIPPGGSSPMPLGGGEQGFFSKLGSGDKNAWRAVAATLYGLADIGEVGKPPGARREKSLSQQYREGLALEDEAADRKAARQETRALAADAAKMREAEFALKIAEFNRANRKDQFDAFGAILTDVSKALDAGIDPAAVMATSAQRAQDAGLSFMVPMLSGASSNREFLTRLGPMYDLVKDDPGAQVFLARSPALTKPGSEQASRFMKDFQDYASTIATRTILNRLRENREAYQGKSFDDVAATLAPDNQFVRDVLTGAVPIDEKLRKSVENGLRTVGVKTPEMIGKRAEEGPDLSPQVKEYITANFGVQPRDLDPTRPADAALIKQGREGVKKEAEEVEIRKAKAQFDPIVADMRAKAEAKVTRARKEVEEQFDKTAPLKATEATSMRGQFQTQSKDFLDTMRAFQRIEDSAKAPSAAGDLAMIFNYMKILDPGSAVREGEQATAANARGVPEAVATIYNRVLTGQRLGDDQRADFLARARTLTKGQLEVYETLEKSFRDIAKKRGGDPDEVAPDVVGSLRKAIKEGKGAESLGERLPVIGPNGEPGTVPKGTKLPKGWKYKA